MTSGLIIGKPGKDALESDLVDTYTNTSNPLLKVALKGRGVMSFGSGETSVIKEINIDYGLSYIPLFRVYADRIPGGDTRIADGVGIKLVSDIIFATSFIVNNKLRIRFQSFTDDPVGNYNYYYFIFYDEVSDD